MLSQVTVTEENSLPEDDENYSKDTPAHDDYPHKVVICIQSSLFADSGPGKEPILADSGSENGQKVSHSGPGRKDPLA